MHLSPTIRSTHTRLLVQLLSTTLLAFLGFFGCTEEVPRPILDSPSTQQNNPQTITLSGPKTPAEIFEDEVARAASIHIGGGLFWGSIRHDGGWKRAKEHAITLAGVFPERRAARAREIGWDTLVHRAPWLLLLEAPPKEGADTSRPILSSFDDQLPAKGASWSSHLTRASFPALQTHEHLRAIVEALKFPLDVQETPPPVGCPSGCVALSDPSGHQRYLLFPRSDDVLFFALISGCEIGEDNTQSLLLHALEQSLSPPTLSPSPALWSTLNAPDAALFLDLKRWPKIAAERDQEETLRGLVEDQNPGSLETFLRGARAHEIRAHLSHMATAEYEDAAILLSDQPRLHIIATLNREGAQLRAATKTPAKPPAGSPAESLAKPSANPTLPLQWRSPGGVTLSLTFSPSGSLAFSGQNLPSPLLPLHPYAPESAWKWGGLWNLNGLLRAPFGVAHVSLRNLLNIPRSHWDDLQRLYWIRGEQITSKGDTKAYQAMAWVFTSKTDPLLLQSRLQPLLPQWRWHAYPTLHILLAEEGDTPNEGGFVLPSHAVSLLSSTLASPSNLSSKIIGNLGKIHLLSPLKILQTAQIIAIDEPDDDSDLLTIEDLPLPSPAETPSSWLQLEVSRDWLRSQITGAHPSHADLTQLFLQIHTQDGFDHLQLSLSRPSSPDNINALLQHIPVFGLRPQNKPSEEAKVCLAALQDAAQKDWESLGLHRRKSRRKNAKKMDETQAAKIAAEALLSREELFECATQDPQTRLVARRLRGTLEIIDAKEEAGKHHWDAARERLDSACSSGLLLGCHLLLQAPLTPLTSSELPRLPFDFLGDSPLADALWVSANRTRIFIDGISVCKVEWPQWIDDHLRGRNTLPLACLDQPLSRALQRPGWRRPARLDFAHDLPWSALRPLILRTQELGASELQALVLDSQHRVQVLSLPLSGETGVWDASEEVTATPFSQPGPLPSCQRGIRHDAHAQLKPEAAPAIFPRRVASKQSPKGAASTPCVLDLRVTREGIEVGTSAPLLPAKFSTLPLGRLLRDDLGGIYLWLRRVLPTQGEPWEALPCEMKLSGDRGARWGRLIAVMVGLRHVREGVSELPNAWLESKVLRQPLPHFKLLPGGGFKRRTFRSRRAHRLSQNLVLQLQEKAANNRKTPTASSRDPRP